MNFCCVYVVIMLRDIDDSAKNGQFSLELTKLENSGIITLSTEKRKKARNDTERRSRLKGAAARNPPWSSAKEMEYFAAAVTVIHLSGDIFCFKKGGTAGDIPSFAWHGTDFFI